MKVSWVLEGFRIQQLKPTIGPLPEGTEPKSEILISTDTSVAFKRQSVGADPCLCEDPRLCECALRKVRNIS